MKIEMGKGKIEMCGEVNRENYFKPFFDFGVCVVAT